MASIALACCLNVSSEFFHLLIVFLEGTLFKCSKSAVNRARALSDFFLFSFLRNSSNILTRFKIEIAMNSTNDRVQKL